MRNANSERSEDIEKELQELSPFLAKNIKKDAKINLKEGYFAELEQKVQQKTKSYSLVPTWYLNIVSWLQFRYVLFAGACVVLLIVLFQNPSANTTKELPLTIQEVQQAIIIEQDTHQSTLDLEYEVAKESKVLDKLEEEMGMAPSKEDSLWIDDLARELDIQE